MQPLYDVQVDVHLSVLTLERCLCWQKCCQRGSGVPLPETIPLVTCDYHILRPLPVQLLSGRSFVECDFDNGERGAGPSSFG